MVLLSGAQELTRNKAIFLVAILALIVGVVAGYSFLPKRYSLGERLAVTNIFWNDKEAFFFLDVSTTGQSSNFLLDKLRATKYLYLGLLLGGAPRFFEQNVTAYHLRPSGELKRLPLPPRPTSFGNWSLHDGKLQRVPVETVGNDRNGFRWDGEKFVSVPPEPIAQTQSDGDSRLRPDDLADEGRDETAFLTPSAREAFKAAGWHYKQLMGYEVKGQLATLPIDLGKASFNLMIRTFPPPTATASGYDLVTFGIKTLELSARPKTEANRELWSQKGWQAISKIDFERRAREAGQIANQPFVAWIWVCVLIGFGLWRFGSWGHLVLSLLATKRHVLNRMATSFSLPPASPGQFPLLDNAGLDRYTQDFEGMGFVRLLDFSLVSDASNPVPSFCRLLVHRRHHCFGEVSQLFPRGKAPLPIKCSIQSILQDGWTLGFTDRKPRAATALIRRKKALGISVPGATTSELLSAFLQMRHRVCQDLGISPLKDDTLEAYVAKVQQAATEMREAVGRKNFATVLPRYLYRKFSLMKAQDEYAWLGDYPKEAERRKQGFSFQARPL
jgi:hypothetical protein